ncbi:MAG: hypothetical protein ACYC1M_10345 [Armatimonadota bacterium]
MKFLAIVSAALVLAIPSFAAPVKTLMNLEGALNSEKQVLMDSSYCAMIAQRQMNLGVASVMKAVNTSAQVHIKKMQKAIKDLGGKNQAMMPSLPPSETDVGKIMKSITAQLNKLVKKDYPAYLKVASQEGAKSANMAFGASSTTDKYLATLINGVANNKKTWTKAQVYFVCPRCGYTVTKITFNTCPICAEPKAEFIKVK